MPHNVKVYEPPRLTVVAFCNERGFASSMPMADRFMLFDHDYNEPEQLEQYTTYNEWHNSSFFD